MPNANSREITRYIRAAEAQGFRVKDKRAGVMVCADGGGAVMLHRTLSDGRGVLNARARLRSIGVDL